MGLKLFTLASLYLSLCLPSYPQWEGDTYEQAKRTRTATFYYVYDGVPGFIEDDGNGNYTGLLVDIMKAFESYIEDKEGITVKSLYKQVPNKDFKVLMTQVKNGQGGVFGLSNVSIKEERKKDYLFSPPYISNSMVLITNTKTPTLTSMDEIRTSFANKKAYSVANSTYYNRLDEIRQVYLPSLEIISLASVNEVMDKVANDNNAFAVVDLNYYIELLKKRVPIKRQSVGDKGGDKFGVIMPKSNDWQPLIEDYFNSGFIGGDEYKALVTKHLGKGALRLIESSN